MLLIYSAVSAVSALDPDSLRSPTRSAISHALPQLEPLDLSRSRFRQLLDELDSARAFVVRHAIFDECLELVGKLLGDTRGRLQHDVGHRPRQIVFVLVRHDSSFEHGMVFGKRVLQLDRRHPFARDSEHVVRPAGYQ